MINKIKIFGLILLFSTILLAGSVIISIKATLENEAVKIEWTVGEEVNLNKYVIERKSDSGNWVDIAQITPKGDYSTYSYVDHTLLKNDNSFSTYYYCIRIVENDGKFTRTKIITATPKISGLKRTWGSIKAMFR
jgi:hypothetical protein